jgi:glycosyltransferase involved in cell wall biosynthesis
MPYPKGTTTPTEPCVPLVSIGIPVYNEIKHIRDTLSCLARINYPSQELIISDNGSDDGTTEVCREFAERYSRFTLHIIQRNQGAVWNFRQVLSLAQGEYFMWAGAHDRVAPECIALCLQSFEQHPQAVLVYGQTRRIRLDGSLGDLFEDRYDSRNTRPLDAFRDLIWNLVACNMVHGLFRMEALERCIALERATVGVDKTLLAEISLKGPIIQRPETLLFRRDVRAPETRHQRMQRQRVSLGLNNEQPEADQDDHDEQDKRSYRELARGHLRVIRHSRLSLWGKFMAMMITIAMCRERYGAWFWGFTSLEFRLKRWLPRLHARHLGNPRTMK